jgi:nucleoside-diphosphate-sugar epimerase
MKILVTGAAGRLGEFVIGEAMTSRHEIVGLDTKPPLSNDARWVSIDLRSVQQLIDAFRGVDAVVHLARLRFPYTSNGFDSGTGAWRYPDTSLDAERYAHNTAITYNVLAACAEAGVRKVACGSSLAIYGFYYPARYDVPDYLPIDENHPLRPQDPYGMSKVAGESICESFARRTGMQIASLRFSGIASAAQYPTLLKRREDPLCRGIGALWTYVDVRDAARACCLAVEKDFAGHMAFNICAPTTIMNEPTAELATRYLPEVKISRPGLQGCWSGYDVARAEDILGFRATHLLETTGSGPPSTLPAHNIR